MAEGAEVVVVAVVIAAGVAAADRVAGNFLAG